MSAEQIEVELNRFVLEYHGQTQPGLITTALAAEWFERKLAERQMPFIDPCSRVEEQELQQYDVEQLAERIFIAICGGNGWQAENDVKAAEGAFRLAEAFLKVKEARK